MFLETQSSLYKKMEDASKALKAIPGIGSGNMGLTPDHIKNSIEYKTAKHNFDSAFQTLRSFNQKFRKEIEKERKAIAKKTKTG